jgi:hypothetical protein
MCIHILNLCNDAVHKLNTQTSQLLKNTIIIIIIFLSLLLTELLLLL